MTTIAIAPRTIIRPARSAQPELRLTRRGRAVVMLFFLAALLLVAVAVASRTAATGDSGVPVRTTEVTVGEGDTLWDIAGDYAEPGRTKDMIREIERLNALPDSTLQVGQVLSVPLR